MPKRKKRSQALRGSQRAAGASTEAGVSLGDSEDSILDMASRITREVPENEWERIPADLSKNIDHYLYGSKKKEK